MVMNYLNVLLHLYVYIINHLTFTFSAEPWISMVFDWAEDTRVRDEDFFRNWVRLLLSAICDSSRLMEEVDSFREALRWLDLSSDALKSRNFGTYQVTSPITLF